MSAAVSAQTLSQPWSLPVNDHSLGHISDFDPQRFLTRTIATGEHCYGCTAGSGSSCGGAVV